MLRTNRRRVQYRNNNENFIKTESIEEINEKIKFLEEMEVDDEDNNIKEEIRRMKEKLLIDKENYEKGISKTIIKNDEEQLIKKL